MQSCLAFHWKTLCVGLNNMECDTTTLTLGTLFNLSESLFSHQEQGDANTFFFFKGSFLAPILLSPPLPLSAIIITEVLTCPLQSALSWDTVLDKATLPPAFIDFTV